MALRGGRARQSPTTSARRTRFWQDWTSRVGLLFAMVGGASYFLLSTPLIIGLALAAGDPRRPGLILVLAGLVLAAAGLWLSFGRPADRSRIVRSIALLFMTLGLGALFVTAAFVAFPYRVEAVRFQNGDVELAGTLLLPRGDGPHPAVVFMHGSGPERGAVKFHLADRFARHGVAALLYDKRGSGASRGGSPWDSYQDLAEDAVAGLRFVQSQPEIDPKHIGLWGMSEGGWTAPLAASLAGDVTFLIVVSGAGASVEMENYYFIDHSLRGKGFAEEEVAQAVALRRRINDYYRTGEGRDEVAASIRQARGEAWLAEAEILPTSIEDVCLFASSCATDYLAFIEFDSTPLLDNLDIPMLFLYGENDRSHPVMDSVRILRERLTAAGDKDVTIVVFPQADHSMLVQRLPVPRFAPGYLDTQITWLLERVSQGELDDQR